MCDLHDHHGLPPLAADEYVLDTPFVRELVARAGADRRARRAPPRRASAIRPVFEQALARRDWLPAEFQRDVPDSGMGGGIGQWLLFRSADRSLCLFSLVVPPGLDDPDPRPPRLGARRPLPRQPGRGVLRAARRHDRAHAPAAARPGDYYVLLPPADDVHRVRTTSAETSVSIHLLANDTGCTERHTFDERTGARAARFAPGTRTPICEAGS